MFLPWTKFAAPKTLPRQLFFRGRERDCFAKSLWRQQRPDQYLYYTWNRARPDVRNKQKPRAFQNSTCFLARSAAIFTTVRAKHQKLRANRYESARPGNGNRDERCALWRHSAIIIEPRDYVIVMFLQLEGLQTICNEVLALLWPKCSVFYGFIKTLAYWQLYFKTKLGNWFFKWIPLAIRIRKTYSFWLIIFLSTQFRKTIVA